MFCLPGSSMNAQWSSEPGSHPMSWRMASRTHHSSASASIGTSGGGAVSGSQMKPRMVRSELSTARGACLSGVSHAPIYIGGHTRDPDMACELVGVAGFEPAASSSRSQVAVSTASAASYLTWERSSVSVRWRPLLALAIVTHLVTRLWAGFGLATWMQTTGTSQVGMSSAGSQRCLRSCMRAVVRLHCCTSCCPKLAFSSA
jgi:hypothetical protein